MITGFINSTLKHKETSLWMTEKIYLSSPDLLVMAYIFILAFVLKKYLSSYLVLSLLLFFFFFIAGHQTTLESTVLTACIHSSYHNTVQKQCCIFCSFRHFFFILANCFLWPNLPCSRREISSLLSSYNDLL